MPPASGLLCSKHVSCQHRLGSCSGSTTLPGRNCATCQLSVVSTQIHVERRCMRASPCSPPSPWSCAPCSHRPTNGMNETHKRYNGTSSGNPLQILEHCQSVHGVVNTDSVYGRHGRQPQCPALLLHPCATLSSPQTLRFALLPLPL